MNNSMTRSAGLAALSLIAVSFSANVEAASVTASMGISDIQTTLLTLSNDQFLTDIATPFQSAFDTGTVLQSNFFSSSSGINSSYAEIDGSLAPLAQIHTGAANSGSGTATVLWTFDWLATGTGTATLNLEYLWDTTVANFQAGEVAIASSSISALVDSTSVQTDVLHFFQNVQGTAGGFDNLLLNFGVTAGQAGTFTVAMTSVSSVAPVPLPAALPLLGSGLLGLFGLGRRRQRKTVVAA